MKNSITIDKGQKEYKDGKVVFKWEYTLSHVWNRNIISSRHPIC